MPADDPTDDLRFELSSPQAYVFQLCQAQLAGDTDAVEQIFDQIGKADLWPMVALIAVAELTQELRERESRGEDPGAWLAVRIQHGLDP